jgi:hypothetical protein
MEIPFPEDITEVASRVTGPLNVPAQIASVSGLDMDGVAEQFDDIIGGDWRNVGVRVPHIFSWAALQDRGCCCYHGGEEVSSGPG